MGSLLYEKIAKDLENKIHNKVLKENDRLSERKLAVEYSVSRTVVREALKLLNEQGLIETHSGVGSYVTKPTKIDVKNIFTNAVRHSDVSIEEVVEAREIFEISMAEIIIERANEQDIIELKHLFNLMEDKMDDGAEFSKLDGEFHTTLMKCTRNEMLILFMSALNDMTDRKKILSDTAVREHAQAEHRQMITAVENHNNVMLKKIFYNHISCIKENLSYDNQETVEYILNI